MRTTPHRGGGKNVDFSTKSTSWLIERVVSAHVLRLSPPEDMEPWIDELSAIEPVAEAAREELDMRLPPSSYCASDEF